MPDFNRNDIPHWADPSDYDRLAEDERLPDIPGVPNSHIHSLDRCEHYTAGDEVGWTCGRFPMFTNIATARAETGRPGKNDLVTVAPDSDGEYWVVSLRSIEGGRLPVAYRRQLRDAEAFRTSVADFITSWFSDEMSEPSSEHEVSLGEAMTRALFAIDDAECLHLSATGVDQNDGPDKVWACDACGFRFVQRVDEDGITHMIPTSR